jgi:ABC-type uncharacterized transport system fused permease/ATPase subunit
MDAASASVSGGLNGGKEANSNDANVINSAEKLRLTGLTVRTPGAYGATRPPLVDNLDLSLGDKSSVLIMGPSGAGKTSLLRAVAGLWDQGGGEVRWRGVDASDLTPESRDQAGGAAADAPNVAENSGMYFLPQRPYLVLGTLRQQLLYPTWIQPQKAEYSTFKPFWANKDGEDDEVNDAAMMEFQCGVAGCAPKPDDAQLIDALERVNLGYLLARGAGQGGGGAARGCYPGGGCPGGCRHSCARRVGAGRRRRLELDPQFRGAATARVRQGVTRASTGGAAG